MSPQRQTLKDFEKELFADSNFLEEQRLFRFAIELGKKLRALREKHSWSRATLLIELKLSNVSIDDIVALESDSPAKMPPLQQVILVAHACGYATEISFRPLQDRDGDFATVKIE